MLDSSKNQSAAEDEISLLQTTVDSAKFRMNGVSLSTARFEDVKPVHRKIPDYDVIPVGVEHALPVFWICAAIVGTLTVTVVLREILLYFKVIGGKQKLSAFHRRCMFTLELFRLVVTTADSYMLLPGALNLARAVDWSPMLSGILDQLDSPGALTGSIVAFALVSVSTHITQRRILVFFITINSALEILLAYVMTIPAVQEAGEVVLFFSVLRFFTGFTAGIGMMDQIMLTSVSSPRENALLGTLVVACLALGGSIGPAIPSISLVFLPYAWRNNAFVCNAVPLLIIASLQAMLAISMSFIVPLNMEQLSHITDTEADQSPQTSSRSTEGWNYDILDYGASLVADSHRAWLVVVGQISGIVASSLALCGLQALPVLLQTEDHWTMWGLGPAVSAISMTSMVSMLACGSIRFWLGTAADKAIGITGSVVGLLGAMLMFDYGLETSKNPTFSGIQLVTGCSMAGAFNGVTGGLLAGYGFAYADETKWYSKEMMSLSIGVSTPLIGLAAGPSARAIAIGPGRNIFAFLIIIFTVTLAAAFIVARFHLMTPKRGKSMEKQ